jgi:hypothetical protein
MVQPAWPMLTTVRRNGQESHWLLKHDMLLTFAADSTGFQAFLLLRESGSTQSVIRTTRISLQPLLIPLAGLALQA